MLKNYLIIALRTMARHKGYALINVVGLAVGMAACTLIMLWVLDELSYDRFNANIDNLYRVEQDQFAGEHYYHVIVGPTPLAPALREEVPEVKETARFVTLGGEILVRTGDTAFYQYGLAAADPSLLLMLTFPMVTGDSSQVLLDPHSVVLSKSTARKFFGDADPVGKPLNLQNEHNVTVTGVIEDTPRNSSVQFGMLIPFAMYERMQTISTGWGNNWLTTFVQLRPGVDVATVEEKMTQTVLRHKAVEFEWDADSIPGPGERNEFLLAPMKDLHLHTYYGYDTGSDATQKIYIVAALALLILLIACINFMNLATARSARRAKEIGLRKILGGYRGQIAGQFYGETVVYAVLAMVLALIIVEAMLPSFNVLTFKQLSLNVFAGSSVFGGLVLIVLLAAAVAGTYPALVLSALQPIKVLGRSSTWRGGGILFRRILVIVQFGLSILIIIATVVVLRQTSYMKNAPLGYNKDQLLCLQLPAGKADAVEALRAELKSSPRVLGVAGSWSSPSMFGSNTSSIGWEGKDPDDHGFISFNYIDWDYVETMQIQMKSGRSFAEHRAGDVLQSVLVNESFEKMMHVDDAIGKKLTYSGASLDIVGVMKDFHFQPLTAPMEPVVLPLDPSQSQYALVRLDAGDPVGAVDDVRAAWERVLPQYPFRKHFLDQDFEWMYNDNERLGALLEYASVLAVLVACLGLYGLAAFLAEQRTKEMGIRIVLGASPGSVVRLLSREFVALVGIAFVIAAPIAAWVTGRWLENFPYRIQTGWLTFVAAGVLAALVATLSVSYHAVRASRVNPAESLKYE